MTRHLIPATLVALALLQGCATPSKPLYDWGPYERQVYVHFKGEAPDAQIQVLERHAQAVKARGSALPPGYMAHLGMLYSKVGRDTEFLLALEEEKRRFPESAPYIDKLISNAKREALDAKH
ncbi:MAG: Lipoprotein [Pseudomonadota bacterium]|jgi:hypothetical protein